jgi:hypothetical protein
MAASTHLSLNHNAYLRDPERTELGRKIISESIHMMDALGFEQFTFKKLAAEISSTEASKAYLTKGVDADNKEEYFLEYKRLCKHIAEMVLALNPQYPYPHTIVSPYWRWPTRRCFLPGTCLPSLTFRDTSGQR